MNSGRGCGGRLSAGRFCSNQAAQPWFANYQVDKAVWEGGRPRQVAAALAWSI